MRKIGLIVLMLGGWLIAIGQNSLDLTLGVGYTGVDIEGLVEKDEVTGTVATDWGQLNIGVSGQYILNSDRTLSYGAELMYHYLYWYSVRIPYGSSNIYRDYSVGAFRITPMIRYSPGHTFALDFGPEFNFSGGFIFGVLLSANYYIPISDNLSVPLKFRLDFLFDQVITVPVSLNAGVRIKM